MVRHSGFLTSLAAVLLAAFSVSILERRSDGSPQIRREEQIRPAVRGLGEERSPGNSSSDSGDSTPVVMGRSDSTIRFSVPADSLIIVGSLDVSGAAHSLVISTQCRGQQTADTSLYSQDQVDLEYIDAARLCDPRWRIERPRACRPDRAESEIPTRADHPETVNVLAGKPTRRFLIPHFEHDQVVQQPCETSPIAEGSRVKVYLDLCMARSESGITHDKQMYEEAKRVCTTIESELLPQIESWIGPVTDLDEDGRLSVVLTDLDRRKSSAETPVLGCVRRGDFSADDQNSLAGDILYLDRHLPPRDQLRALLAHELTHAAIFCIRHEAPNDSLLRNHSVPAWLNEAAAHWVERQFCSTPAGFAAREAAFRQSPAMCPIMMKDDDHSLTARRTGSRVAGFSFLQQHLTDVRDLRSVIEESLPFDQSISAIARAPFSQLFRDWTISHACGDPEALSPMHTTMNCCSLTAAESEPVRRKLHGTAFLVLQSEAEQSVSIKAHGDAKLQITVLHQANSLSTQHIPNISSEESPRSAALNSMPRSEIQ